MKQTKRYDKENKRIILYKKYLLSFTKSDGFSDRLLLAELTIDWQNQYFLQMSSFECRNRQDNLYEEQGTVPVEIINFVDSLIKADYKSLKNNYDYEFSVDDVGHNYFHLNFDDVTSSIVITSGLTPEYFESNAEKVLFNFNQYLTEWIEIKYLSWVSI